MSTLDAKTTGNVFLLLLENGEDYDHYEDKKDSFGPHELLVCCLSVSATNYCEKNGVTFTLPEDSFTQEESEYYRELSEERIKSLVKHLNDYYHKKESDLGGFLFDVGNYHYFFLYHFFNALHYRAFFLSKIIKQHNIDRILVTQVEGSNTNRPFPVSLYENCYLELIQNSIFKEKILCIPIPSKISYEHTTLKIRIRGWLSKTLRSFEITNEYINCVRNNIPISFFRLLSGRVKSDILLIGAAYNWKNVFKDSEIGNRVSVFNGLDEIHLPSKMVKNWFKDWFNWEDNFCGFTVSNLGYYEMARINIISKEMLSSHNKTIKIIETKNALIYSVAPYATQQYYLSIGKFLNIPRICFQHGAMACYYDGLWCASSELLYHSHYFSFGDQVSIDKINSSKHTEGFEKVISIGSPALDQIRKTKSSGNSYILYASSKYITYGAGFLARYVDEVVRKNQIILLGFFEKYLNSNVDTEVIWKLNQNRLSEQPFVTV